MERSPIGTRAGALLLGACLALAGCTEGGEGTSPPGRDDPTDAGASSPSAVPNFTFSIDAAYRDDPDVPDWFVDRLDSFFEGTLEPLQRLPGLMSRTVSITYGRCGEANAFHDGEDDTIRLCHELSAFAYEVFEPTYSDDTPEDPEDDLQDITERVLYAMGFVLYHEIAHALDHQRGLTIGGNIESAMDSIATVMAVETGQSLHALAGAVLFAAEPPSLADAHGGGVDRLGDINCLALGGDTFIGATFANPEIRETFDYAGAGRDCVGEYAERRDLVRSWVPGLARLKGAGAPLPDDFAGGTSEFRVDFGPRWLDGAGASPAGRERLERLFDHLLAPLEQTLSGLAEPIGVLYEDCGVATSSYDPGTNAITLCEELVELAYADQIERTRAVTGREPNPAELNGLLTRAHDALGFDLYHEIGHVLDAAGRLPEDEGVESAADAIAAVLLVESGRGLVAGIAIAALQRRTSMALGTRNAPDDRIRNLTCLVVGGDAALRASPFFATPVILETYVTGERDCIAEYAARRDEVALWLTGR